MTDPAASDREEHRGGWPIELTPGFADPDGVTDDGKITGRMIQQLVPWQTTAKTQFGIPGSRLQTRRMVIQIPFPDSVHFVSDTLKPLRYNHIDILRIRFRKVRFPDRNPEMTQAPACRDRKKSAWPDRTRQGYRSRTFRKPSIQYVERSAVLTIRKSVTRPDKHGAMAMNGQTEGWIIHVLPAQMVFMEIIRSRTENDRNRIGRKRSDRINHRLKTVKTILITNLHRPGMPNQ